MTQDRPTTFLDRRAAAALVAALFASALAARLSASAEASAQAPAAEEPPKAGAQSGAEWVTQSVDVGGYSLMLASRGTGGPTVVIEPGMGLPAVESGEWKAVADEIARTNRVVLYDRAGLGSSGAPAKKSPRTARDVARDLHTLLAKANVPGPCVLVGHSVGGLYVRAYADRYPDEVAGVVLVDAAHPDQEAQWLAALPRAKSGEDPAVSKARAFLRSRIASRAENPDRVDLAASRDHVRAARNLGDKPLAVLAHSPDWKMVPDLPDDVMKKLEQVTQDLQAATAKLSKDGSHVVAKHAGHAIHVDEPQLVIDAIRDVARRSTKAASGKTR